MEEERREGKRQSSTGKVKLPYYEIQYVELALL